MRIDLREESGGGILELEDLEVRGEKMREIAEVFGMEEGRLEILVIEGILEVRGFIALVEGELMGLGDGGVEECECGDSGGAEGLRGVLGEGEGEQGGEWMGEDEGRCGDTVGSEGL